MNILQQAGYCKSDDPDWAEKWFKWENGNLYTIDIRKDGSLQLNIEPKELTLVGEYVQAQPYHGNRESLLDSSFGKCGSELLGDYIITDKGKLALKDREIEELKKDLSDCEESLGYWKSECISADKDFKELKAEINQLRESNKTFADSLIDKTATVLDTIIIRTEANIDTELNMIIQKQDKEIEELSESYEQQYGISMDLNNKCEELEQQLEAERKESDYWYSRKEEETARFWTKECDFQKLKKNLEAKDVQISALSDEVKYWTDNYNKEVQARDKDRIALDGIMACLGVE